VDFCKRSQRCPHRKESVVREHENSKFVKAALCELKVGVPPLNLCRPELCVFSGMYQSKYDLTYINGVPFFEFDIEVTERMREAALS
jgi:hypothetical protein